MGQLKQLIRFQNKSDVKFKVKNFIKLKNTWPPNHRRFETISNKRKNYHFKRVLPSCDTYLMHACMVSIGFDYKYNEIIL